MNDLDQNRFTIGAQFRHDKGGCWEITKVDGERLTIKAMPGTAVKHRAILLGRNFKIFGSWFKITNCDEHTITLARNPRKPPTDAEV